MSRRIVTSMAVFLVLAAFAAPVQGSILTILPENLVPTQKIRPVRTDDFVRQSPEGVFALVDAGSDPAEFWAPVKLPAGSKIKAVSFAYSVMGGSAKVELSRIASGDSQLIAEAVGTDPNGWQTATTNISYPYHAVATGYRYFVKVKLDNDCIVQKINIKY